MFLPWYNHVVNLLHVIESIADKSVIAFLSVRYSDARCAHHCCAFPTDCRLHVRRSQKAFAAARLSLCTNPGSHRGVCQHVQVDTPAPWHVVRAYAEDPAAELTRNGFPILGRREEFEERYLRFKQWCKDRGHSPAEYAVASHCRGSY